LGQRGPPRMQRSFPVVDDDEVVAATMHAGEAQRGSGTAEFR
jgi:hypothetical protein